VFTFKAGFSGLRLYQLPANLPDCFRC